MGTPISVVDAFTAVAFRGNPAAICVLDAERDAPWMQRVAMEMNLSETAFLVPRADGFGLRWFTPTQEVALCGHATLASAHLLWERGRLREDQAARFHTLSGVLTCNRRGGRIEMDFPAVPVEVSPPDPAVLKALGLGREHVVASGLAGGRSFLHVRDEATVLAVQPDFAALKAAGSGRAIVTAQADAGRDYAFVSRCFAPIAGINEDPVTGSAHCVLAPYWCGKLGAKELTGYQASARGGTVGVRPEGDRVVLSGQAVTVWRGELV